MFHIFMQHKLNVPFIPWFPCTMPVLLMHYITYALNHCQLAYELSAILETHFDRATSLGLKHEAMAANAIEKSMFTV